MNPSCSAVSEVPWGADVTGHLANKSVLGWDASPDSAHNASHAMFSCQSCGKQYPRLCDLNTHTRTHSRPFKCSVHDCRHYTCGWPTVKELDRHYNDKHSAEPHAFTCLWHGCKYSSKRESNCKQHMEKAHGYHYVRNRAGNSAEHAIGPFNLSGAAHDPSSQSRSRLAIRTLPNVLLTPSIQEQPSPAAPDAASPLGANGPALYDRDIHVPWNPPVTTLTSNEAFVQDFRPTHDHGTPSSLQDNEWLRVPVDPRLYNAGSTGASSPDYTPTSPASSNQEELFSALTTVVSPEFSPAVASQILTPVSDTNPFLTRQLGHASEATTSNDSEPPRSRGQNSVQISSASSVATLNSHGKRQVRFEDGEEDGTDEDDEPPTKRNKALEDDDDDNDDEPRLICPFRVRHPEIYDVEARSRYSSCHTEHKNISTVVRHLGRSAHNLRVDNGRQAIHSFDVSSNEHGHPAAGLCKKCWRSFTDRGAFDAHVRARCGTASRSKRDKFQALIDTFCVTEQDSRATHSDASGAYERNVFEGDLDAPLSATSSWSRSHCQDVVRRQEYQTLVDRVHALEQMMGGLPQATPRVMPSQQTVACAFTASPAVPSQTFGYYTFSPGPDPPTASGSRDSRLSIVGGLDVHPLEAGNDAHSVPAGGYYNDTDRIATQDYRPSLHRPTASVSTVRRTSPIRVASAQPAGGIRVGRAVADAAYATDIASQGAAASGNPRLLGGGGGGHLLLRHHQGMEAFGATATAGGATATPQDAGVGSQHHGAHAMMRDRWESGMQGGEDLMMRGMEFLNSQGSGDDLTKYLNLDAQ